MRYLNLLLWLLTDDIMKCDKMINISKRGCGHLLIVSGKRGPIILISDQV